MKRIAAVLIAVSLNAWSWAQDAPPPTATPKKDPFAGFGSSLDQRPGGKSANSFNLLPRTPAPNYPSAPPNPAPAVPGSLTGVVLAKEWAGHLSEGAGGQTMKMKDLQDLLSAYGKADRDIDPHPDVTVYEGSPLDPSLGQNCRITYLMPLGQAEKLLFKSRGIVTGGRVVAPGFPDGLFMQVYEVRAGIYNHLIILTDVAQQVLSLEFKADGANYYPQSPPFTKLARNWHTHDYMNTQNKGQPGLQIDTRVKDMRSSGRYIVVNMTGGSELPQLAGPIVLKPARASPKEATTWYVPDPLISLILYTLSKQLGFDEKQPPSQ